jgi:hypothetical protein
MRRAKEAYKVPSRFLAAALACLVALGLTAGTAEASTPTVIATAGPAFGRSAWTYRDLRDSAAKYEGGYAAFEQTSTERFTTSPHGGYNTTTNKCKVCHAVHRAESAYYLTRAESQGDACTYCHVGSAHSSTVVYDSDPAGTSASAGHRIGAPSVIPVSTTHETLATVTVTSTDASGVVSSMTVTVRSADEQGNRMYRLGRSHGQSAAGEQRFGYTRIGPTALTCMSCHQVHNAVNEVWRPTAFGGGGARLASGYKLLRASPSGSIQGTDDMPYGDGVSAPATVSYTTDGMRGFKAYTQYRTTGLVNAGNAVRVPETTLTAGTYGPGRTIWDSPDWGYVATASGGPARERAAVNQYALSVWCADCHNLAIGDFRAGTVEELGFPSHESSRTHSVPFAGAYNGPAQCYTCHRADLAAAPATAAYDGTQASCERCHYGTGSYAVDPKRLSPGGSDFPHSSEASGAYMLGAWSMDATTGVVTPTAITPLNTRLVCLRCHREGQLWHGHIAIVATMTASGALLTTAGVPYTYEGTTTEQTYGGQECGSCHYTDLVREHGKASSSSAAARCDACHPQPRASFAQWNKTCQQGGCHATFHADMAARHAQTQVASCAGGGDPTCHGGAYVTDGVDAIHNGFWFAQQVSNDATLQPPAYPLMPKNGCTVCHTGPSTVPASTDCVACHPTPPH